ncbi:Phosphomannomutase/phosphoglucomutase [uncultured delta proteobacterium]|uniref:Phosphomannomutase/phosphoglucomutase n=1 Tax=uncultured delta proteobacterium TaxID=34034 RepID=A0A212K069_9DELT|nr:Phosphomannomutase/phosphoglucomutase [uncultured delta proteobacterium]
MRTVSSHVFRAYDIRGLVGVDFDAQWVHLLGRACGTVFKKQGRDVAVVGHDCRESSPEYAEALIRGITESGVSVISIGMVPTPFVYYAVKSYGTGAGVMVTASHNPSEYNGFKVWCGESTLYNDGIDELRRLMISGAFTSGAGGVESRSVFPAYLADVAGRVAVRRPLKVVVDGGNGAGGEFCADMLERLGAEVIRLFCEPDGSFPNHHPDPVVEKNMVQLQQRVLAEKADLGIGLDGDGDRIGAVDETGRLLFGDELLALYAREVLERKPGSVVLGDVKCSHRLFRDIAAHGGHGEMCATGHSFMKAKMREMGAELGGEMSGHMFFADRWYGFDDALYAAARLLELVAAAPVPLSKLLGWPQSFVTPELHMDCPDAVKGEVMAKALAYFRERYDILDTDGVRLVFSDGWGLVRASNTQPVLVLRFEAESAARLDAIRDIVERPIAAWIAEAEKGSS